MEILVPLPNPSHLHPYTYTPFARPHQPRSAPTPAPKILCLSTPNNVTTAIHTLHKQLANRSESDQLDYPAFYSTAASGRRRNSRHHDEMLSNPLHRFSPYSNIPSTTLFSSTHVPNGHSGGLNELPQAYGMQQMQQHVGVHDPHLARGGPQPKHRQHPYGPGPRSAAASGPVRRRISRACDQCNQLRTKCDGQHPCAHCVGKHCGILSLL